MLGMALASGDLLAQSVGPGDTRQVGTKRMVTQGLAKTVNENLFKCEVELRNYRISAVGTIAADNGTVLTVPAQTAYQTGPKLADLFNECSKTTPPKLADASLENVPVVEIDPDDDVITGYIVADNYFELYVNGKLIGVDPVPFTPFNSAIVRFKAKRPYTYALKAVGTARRRSRKRQRPRHRQIRTRVPDRKSTCMPRPMLRRALSGAAGLGGA